MRFPFIYTHNVLYTELENKTNLFLRQEHEEDSEPAKLPFLAYIPYLKKMKGDL
jgi:hypothetical protein